MAQMTAQEAAEWGKTLSFETVWSALMKLEEKVDRVTANIDRVTANMDRLDKVVENIDQVTANMDRLNKVAENMDRVTAKVDRVSENVGGLNRSVGELVETLIAARLWEKFPEYDFKRAYQRLPVYDEKFVRFTDIDVLLVNNDMCMVVEVKRELDRMDDVDEHLKRMQLIRKYPPEIIGSKQLLGAMAGGVVDPNVKENAYKSGFYVLELTGESVHLIPPPEGFEPKKW
jgi:outer membrane murein-binding lipoprotein Lpp